VGKTQARLRCIGRKLQPSSRFKVRLPDKQADSFYCSPAWRALCDEIKQERWPHLKATQGHYCEDPACTARHSIATRTFFDHVKERRDRPDLALVKSNIMGRCGASHSAKTAQVRARRHGVTAG
jgi:5-methylcytosine-specific restriction protein A